MVVLLPRNSITQLYYDLNTRAHKHEKRFFFSQKLPNTFLSKQLKEKIKCESISMVCALYTHLYLSKRNEKSEKIY